MYKQPERGPENLRCHQPYPVSACAKQPGSGTQRPTVCHWRGRTGWLAAYKGVCESSNGWDKSCATQGSQEIALAIEKHGASDLHAFSWGANGRPRTWQEPADARKGPPTPSTETSMAEARDHKTGTFKNQTRAQNKV